MITHELPSILLSNQMHDYCVCWVLYSINDISPKHISWLIKTSFHPGFYLANILFNTDLSLLSHQAA